ncbi:MAG: WD40/YVTN/BNR-like repeat-containing protein [Chitinophagales bacterium]
MRTIFFNNGFIFGLIGFSVLFAACNSHQDTPSKPQTSKAPDFKNLQWAAQTPATDANLRGLCVVSDRIVWASGSKGTFLRTADGGKSWFSKTIEGTDSLDFRDIHAFDENRAVVLSSGFPAHIYKTTDGGKTWQQTYFNEQEGVFFDGFDFANEKEGMAFSDPIDGKLFIIKTTDGGDSWQAIDTTHLPDVLTGEAGYAASGTGIIFKDQNIWIATGGGERARVLHSEDSGTHWQVFDTPIVSAEGKGIFSMAMSDAQNGVVVGGAYMDSTNKVRNCAITQDGGKNWELIATQQPNGYRSCVASHATEQLLIAVGRTGSDISEDKGKSWTSIGQEGYYSCGIAAKTAWAVGRSGKMAKMDFRLP